jgi:hypothetical protein
MRLTEGERAVLRRLDGARLGVHMACLDTARVYWWDVQVLRLRRMVTKQPHVYAITARGRAALRGEEE